MEVSNRIAFSLVKHQTFCRRVVWQHQAAGGAEEARSPHSRGGIGPLLLRIQHVCWKLLLAAPRREDVQQAHGLYQGKRIRVIIIIILNLA